MSRHNDLLYLDDMADHARHALRIAQKLGTYESFEAERVKSLRAAVSTSLVKFKECRPAG